MEFTLIKVNTETTKEKLKSNLNGVHEVSFQKAHEVGFQKTHCQVKFFLKNVDLSLFDVDKDVNCQGDLINEANMLEDEVQLVWPKCNLSFIFLSLSLYFL